MQNYYYEEYMNSLLGYPMGTRNVNTNIMDAYEENNSITYNQSDHALEECYPDIYKIVYPMICKACLFINEEITEELVERITNEIYENLEQEEIPEEKRSMEVKVNYSNLPNNRNIRYANQNTRIENLKEEKTVETRQRNFLLNDLIKILVLRELIGRGKRPPKRPMPQRPPMPPRPPIF